MRKRALPSRSIDKSDYDQGARDTRTVVYLEHDRLNGRYRASGLAQYVFRDCGSYNTKTTDRQHA
jgi:hypothetical protein